MRSYWKKKTNLHKALSVISAVANLIFILIVMLEIFGVLSWDEYSNKSWLIFDISLISQSILIWKSNRGAAIFILCAAIFSLVAIVIETLLGYGSL